MRQARRVEQRVKRRSEPLPSDHVVEVEVTEMLEPGWVEARLPSGRRLRARCPQHIDQNWLRAAIKVAPVEAAVAFAGGAAKRALLWSIFPGPQHEQVRADLHLRAGRVVLDGQSIRLD